MFRNSQDAACIRKLTERVSRLEKAVANLQGGSHVPTSDVSISAEGAISRVAEQSVVRPRRVAAGPGITAEVQESLESGKYVQAIRAYRRATGAKLADAKYAVDDYMRRQGM